MKKVRECDTRLIRRTKHWEVVVGPPFGQTMRTNSVLTTYFPYNITTIYIQYIFAITGTIYELRDIWTADSTTEE
jgi:hypothetical protein